MGGCAAPVLPGCGPGDAGVAWIVDYGWHTEIVLPAAAVDGPLAPVRRVTGPAAFVSFGFGKRSFMTRTDPGLADLLGGAVPGEGTIRVIGLRAAPAQVYGLPIVQLPLGPAETAALQRFLWATFRTDGGAPIPVAAEPGNPDPGRFFAATPGYSLAYTCNAWTVDALGQAGLPVGGTIVFASGAMRQAVRVPGACDPAHAA